MVKWGPVLAAILSFTVLLTACGASRSNAAGAPQRQLLISAAASLEDAFQEIKQGFEADNPDFAVTYNFGASGNLQIQIEQGAPADVFASAGEAQVDALERKNLLAPGSRRNFASNTAVLIVGAGAAAANSGRSDINDFSDLTKPEIKHIAIGNPDSVPAGTYAKQILQSERVWDGIQSKIVQGANVRQVLTYVESGNAEAGIVYSTDAATSNKVKVVGRAPEADSTAIVYPIAAIASSKSPKEAEAFVDFVTGPKGQSILAKYGFLPAREESR